MLSLRELYERHGRPIAELNRTQQVRGPVKGPQRPRPQRPRIQLPEPIRRAFNTVKAPVRDTLLGVGEIPRTLSSVINLQRDIDRQRAVERTRDTAERDMIRQLTERGITDTRTRQQELLRLRKEQGEMPNFLLRRNPRIIQDDYARVMGQTIFDVATLPIGGASLALRAGGRLAGKQLAKHLGNRAVEGGAFMAGRGIAGNIEGGISADEAKNIGIETLLGAGVGAGIGGIEAGIKRALANRIARRQAQNVATPQPEVTRPIEQPTVTEPVTRTPVKTKVRKPVRTETIVSQQTIPGISKILTGVKDQQKVTNLLKRFGMKPTPTISSAIARETDPAKISTMLNKINTRKVPVETPTVAQPEQVNLFEQPATPPVSQTADSPLTPIGNVLEGYQPKTTNMADTPTNRIASQFNLKPNFVDSLLRDAGGDETLVTRAIVASNEVPDIRNKEAWTRQFVRTNGFTREYVKKPATQATTTPETVTTPVTQPVDAPVTPPVKPPVKQPKGKRLLQVLPDRETITDADTHRVSVQGIRDMLIERGKEIRRFMDENNIKDEDIQKLWDTEGAVAPTLQHQQALKMLKDLDDEIYEVSNTHMPLNKSDHMPRVFDTEIDELTQFFNTHTNTNPIVDILFKNPHRLAFKGTGEGYITDPILATITRGVRAVQEYLRPMTKAQRDIVKHITELGDNAIDIIGKLQIEVASEVLDTMPIIQYSMGIRLPALRVGNLARQVSAPIRQRYNIFEHIGQEVPELFKAYTRVIANDDLRDITLDRAKKFIENKDTEGLVRFLGEYAGFSGDNFVKTSLRYIRDKGYDRYVRMILSTKNKSDMANFVNISSNYRFADTNTREFVSKFIADKLKLDFAESNLEDAIFNSVNRMFSAAHLGLSPVTSLVQLADVSYIWINYTPRQVLAGLKAAFAAPINYGKSYGIYNSYRNFAKENRLSGNIEKNIGLVENLIHIGTTFIESFKNRLFLGAAELKGKQMGLTGYDLVHYVRNQLFKRGNISHPENMPSVLKDSSLNRSIFSYSQFIIKKWTETGDHLLAGEYAKAIKMMSTMAVNAMLIAYIFNRPIEHAWRAMFPAGPGPLFTVPLDFYRSFIAEREAEEKGNPTARFDQRQMDMFIRNFIPAGTQGLRVSKAHELYTKGYRGTPYRDDVKFLAPDSPTSKLGAYLFGPGVLDASRDYFDSGRTPLGEVQSGIIRSLPRNERQAYYDKIHARRDIEREDKKAEKQFEGSDENVGKPLPSGKVYVPSLDRRFDTQAEANLEIAKEDFKNSPDAFREFENYVFRKKADGDTIVQTKEDFNIDLNNAKLSLYRQKRDDASWNRVAQEQIRLLSIKLQSPDLDELERVRVEADMARLLRGIGGGANRLPTVRPPRINRTERPRVPRVTAPRIARRQRRATARPRVRRPRVSLAEGRR